MFGDQGSAAIWAGWARCRRFRAICAGWSACGSVSPPTMTTMTINCPPSTIHIIIFPTYATNHQGPSSFSQHEWFPCYPRTINIHHHHWTQLFTSTRSLPWSSPRPVDTPPRPSRRPPLAWRRTRDGGRGGRYNWGCFWVKVVKNRKILQQIMGEGHLSNTFIYPPVVKSIVHGSHLFTIHGPHVQSIKEIMI